MIAGLFAFSNFAVAQEASDNPYIYETQDEVAESDDLPGNPGDPQPAPIDDYLPVLFFVIVAITLKYKRERYLQK